MGKPILREKTVVDAIVKRLKTVRESFHVNYHGNPWTRKGTPDLFFTCTAIGGRSVWIEAKRPGETSTEIQKITQERLRRAGAIVFEADSWKTVVDTLAGYGVRFDEPRP